MTQIFKNIVREQRKKKSMQEKGKQELPRLWGILEAFDVFFETVKQQQQSIETKNQYPNSNKSLNHEKKKREEKKTDLSPK